MYIYIHTYICVCVYLYICLSNISICLSIKMSIYIYIDIYLCVCLTMCLYVSYLSNCLSVFTNSPPEAPVMSQGYNYLYYKTTLLSFHIIMLIQYMAICISSCKYTATVTSGGGRKRRGQQPPCVTACVRPDARREFSTDEKGCARRQSAPDKGSASAGTEPRAAQRRRQ